MWGASFVATRVALEAFHPFALVAMRLVLGAGLLLLVVRWQGGGLLKDRRDWLGCGALGLVLAAHLLIQAYGLLYTSAIHTGWIIGFIPVTVAVGAQLLGQQRLRPVGWLGVATGTAGVLLVTAVEPANFAHAHFGDFLQITACFTWAVYTLGGVGVTRRNGTLRVTAVAMSAAALVCVLLTAHVGVVRGTPALKAFIAVSFLGLLCSGVAYYLWFNATHQRGPTRIAALLYFEPFVTLVLAAAVLHEPVTMRAGIGGCVVLAGVWLVARGSQAAAVRNT